ncbi:MAG: sensor histidine kinase [Solirubrobacterales bacterium]
MDILSLYLKSRMKWFLLFGLFSIIFAIIFSLYSLQLEAVLYSVVLCFFLGAIFTVFDYMIFFKRHKQLMELTKYITLSLEKMPKPFDLLENDYQKLIQILYKDKAQNISNSDLKYSSMINYYTLWAHQIKTPISAMHLLLQTEGRENNELELELFKIEQYVEMVLQYLRLGSEATDYLLGKYNLQDIVKQAIRKYAKMFISKKISLDLQDINLNIVTDEKWTVFVIEQVLSNAIKYTNKGCIRIYLDDNDTLVIEDQGIGIQKEDIPRVFERGFTGFNGRYDKKSTGIGLYLSKEVMNKLSHTISLDSEPGVGTKVKLGFNSHETIRE